MADSTSTTKRDRLAAIMARQSKLYGQIDQATFYRRLRKCHMHYARTSATTSTRSMYVREARHANRQLLAEIRKEQARGVIACGVQVAA